MRIKRRDAGGRASGRGRDTRSMASNFYMVRPWISRLQQVRPGAEPSLPIPSPARPTPPPRPSPTPPKCFARGSTAAARPRPSSEPGLPRPPRLPVLAAVLLESRGSPPLPRHPHSLPSFPQRMSGFQINLVPLKEPLGFIKILEWVSAAGAARGGELGTAGGPAGRRITSRGSRPAARALRRSRGAGAHVSPGPAAAREGRAGFLSATGQPKSAADRACFPSGPDRRSIAP